MADPSPRLDLPQGTLDLLILKAIALDPQHGWAISERIQQISNNALQVNQGSLYPALHRLERRGWIKAEWDVSDNNRRAKYYELTKKGRKQLEEQTRCLARVERGDQPAARPLVGVRRVRRVRHSCTSACGHAERSAARHQR